MFEAMLLHGGGCLPQNNLTFLATLKEEIESKISGDCDLLIVEMALTQKECIEHLLDPLMAKYHIMHIILKASAETISARIKSDSERDQKFALDHLLENVAFLEQNYPEALYIDTEDTSIQTICDNILVACGLVPPDVDIG